MTRSRFSEPASISVGSAAFLILAAVHCGLPAGAQEIQKTEIEAIRHDIAKRPAGVVDDEIGDHLKSVGERNARIRRMKQQAEYLRHRCGSNPDRACRNRIRFVADGLGLEGERARMDRLKLDALIRERAAALAGKAPPR